MEKDAFSSSFLSPVPQAIMEPSNCWWLQGNRVISQRESDSRACPSLQITTRETHWSTVGSSTHPPLPHPVWPGSSLLLWGWEQFCLDLQSLTPVSLDAFINPFFLFFFNCIHLLWVWKEGDGVGVGCNKSGEVWIGCVGHWMSHMESISLLGITPGHLTVSHLEQKCHSGSWTRL